MYISDLNNDEKQTRPILYALSNYLWLIFLFLIILSFNIKKQFQFVSTIKSYNHSRKWNSLNNPHIFGLISDLHISQFYPETILDTKAILNILNETGVEKILISGDIVDNFKSNSSIKHGQQYENDFVLFSKIFSKYQNDRFIIASDNHDEFGIDQYNSTNHFILKHVNFYKNNEVYKNYDNFLISKVKYNDIDIFVMNPYRYPTVKAGLGYFMNLNRQMLDTIEKVISEPSNSSARLLLTHYPLTYNNAWKKSTSQKKLIDIVTSNNITAILCGHTHKDLIIHRKTSLEIQTMSVKGGIKKGGAYRYISIDNGALSTEGYRLIDEKPVALLTHPVQKKYLSDMIDFSYQNFLNSEIRVVHFSENPNLNISVSCSTKINDYNDITTGFLQFQRVIRPNESLYSTSLKKLCNRENFNNKNVNKYHLDFRGDWNYSADFVFGDSVKLKKETLSKDLDMKKGIIMVGIICWFILAFIWMPIKPLKYCDTLNSLITNNQFHWFDKVIAILFGFLTIKSRIYHNIASWIRYYYFIIVFAPLFVPISMMKIGSNSYGFIFYCGYYLKSFEFDIWGAMLSSYYVIFVLLTSTIVFSSISYLNETKKWQFVFIIDIMIFLSQFWLIKVSIFHALYQSTSLIYALTSPIFIFSPISIICIEIISFASFLQNSKIKENCKEYNLILI